MPLKDSCEGVKTAMQVTLAMAETTASLRGLAMAPEREAAIRKLVTDAKVGFVDDPYLLPEEGAYNCLFDCAQCLGKVGLSTKGGVSIIEVPEECPNHDQAMVITGD